MDKEKTIKGLHDIGCFIAGRVGFEQAKNFLHTIDEAVALLKEQDAVEPFHKCIGNEFSRIANELIEDAHYDYCPYCGIPIGEGMDIGNSERYIFNNVKIRDTGSLLPVVFDIHEGYRRGGLIKSDKGEYAALIGVSNTKVDEPSRNYERQKDEEISYVIGLIIQSKNEAEVLSEFLK